MHEIIGSERGICCPDAFDDFLRGGDCSIGLTKSTQSIMFSAVQRARLYSARPFGLHASDLYSRLALDHSFDQ